MKSHTDSVPWTYRAGSNADVAIDTHTTVRRQHQAQPIHSWSFDCRPPSSASLSTPLTWVGVLAFCQVIIFLALFLFICARAGAATENKSAHGPELIS